MPSPKPGPASRTARGGGGERAERGRAAETLVLQGLDSRGWKVLCRNLRVGRLELDLVAEHDGVLHVVEVRSRVGTHAGGPLETVGPAKRRALARAVAAALAGGLLPRGREVRFDVAAVVWEREGAEPRIELYENAFDAVDLL
ncbi:MAG: YraN family protein [Deltaproteobacteria bacterium]|nr:YraN family protein [Deltaproteobacteria bacterium]